MSAGSPQELGERYRLVEKIGSGGAASVFLAEDLLLARQVAVKRLHADGPDDAARRFRREARISAGLSHANLVAIFDAFSDGEDLVIVMEYVPGRDLSELLGHGAPEREKAFRILDGLAEAVDHLHAAGIVHRDIKPSNVLLGPDDETVKLTDLGIARVLEDTATTQADAVPGSLPYMSPDQLSGGTVEQPSDIYSFGLVALEVLSGEKARRGSPAEIGHRTLNEPPPDIRDVLPGAPPAAAELLLRTLSRDPQERPMSARAVVAGLREAFAEADVETREEVPVPVVAEAPDHADPTTRERIPFTPPGPRRGEGSPWRWAGAAALVLVLVAVGLVALLGDGSDGVDPAGTEPSSQARSGDSNDAGGGSGQTASSDSADPAADALESFYVAAAEDDFTAASELASPNLIGQLGGESGLESTFATLESISFDELRTLSDDGSTAEVAFSTTAVHTDRTESCTGTATMVESEGTWLVDSLAGVECS
ncbi:serine/threonine protein kinase [Thermoleophilia bacterium SCSIO 60948]|nr:serine/threonine protein kinase [Thermoleophilia bacterium SCSIO 60948]